MSSRLGKTMMAMIMAWSMSAVAQDEDDAAVAPPPPAEQEQQPDSKTPPPDVETTVIFDPSEEVSEDLSVSFPADI